MPHRLWAERMEDELIRRGIPAKYRHRLLSELEDHADDLTEEGTTVQTEVVLNSRLGDPVTLAAQAAEEYRRARWASRHPLLVFGVLPLPATLLMVTAMVLLFVLADYGLGRLVGGVDRLPRPTLVVLVYSVAWGIRFVPFVLLAVLFTRLYLRSCVSWWWFATAAVQILLVAGSLVSVIQYSNEPGQSAWLAGFVWMPLPLGDEWGSSTWASTASAGCRRFRWLFRWSSGRSYSALPVGARQPLPAAVEPRSEVAPSDDLG